MPLQEHIKIRRPAVVEPGHDLEDARLIAQHSHALAMLDQQRLQPLGRGVTREQPRRPQLIGHIGFLPLNLFGKRLTLLLVLGLGRVLLQSLDSLFGHHACSVHASNLAPHPVPQQLFPIDQRRLHGRQHSAFARAAGGCAQSPKTQRLGVAVSKRSHNVTPLQHSRQHSQRNKHRQSWWRLSALTHRARHISEPARQYRCGHVRHRTGAGQDWRRPLNSRRSLLLLLRILDGRSQLLLHSLQPFGFCKIVEIRQRWEGFRHTHPPQSVAPPPPRPRPAPPPALASHPDCQACAYRCPRKPECAAWGTWRAAPALPLAGCRN